MNSNRYFMPLFGRNPLMHTGAVFSRGYPNFNIFGLLERLGGSIKKINWHGLLNGVNKTLNVVNQTIPLVKQARPMFDNVRSMLLLTKAFHNETKHINNRYSNVDNIFMQKKADYSVVNNISDSTIKTENKPIFFI